MMALTMSENNFGGSLDGSDSNESVGSEPYEMYLTVGEGVYSVSTNAFDDKDPAEQSNPEELTNNNSQAVVGNATGSIAQGNSEETAVVLSGRHSSDNEGIAQPESSNALMQNSSPPASLAEDVAQEMLYDNYNDNSSDTEDYSVDSDDNQQFEEAGNDNDMDRQVSDDQQTANTGLDTDLDISIKTEPSFDEYSSPVCDQSPQSTDGTQKETADISPSKMFSLRLNLFNNKSLNRSDSITSKDFDFQTLDNVIAAAVSKTYGASDSTGNQHVRGSSGRGGLPAIDSTGMTKPVEETKSGVVVLDVPVHIEGKLFHSCSICHKTFKTPKELRVHSRVHTKEKPYVCYVCGKSFRQQAHLNSHYKIHSGEKPYSCTLCSLSFTENSSLKRHIRIHLGIRPYKCDICDDAFVTSYLLKTHKTRRHEAKQHRKQFACTRCPKIYTSKETFNKHLRSHDPDTRIACSFCGQVCLTSSHLKRHVNVHMRTDVCNLQSKDKPFECGICHKTYFNKKHLELHVVRHSQTETFSCEVCGKGFDTRYKWRRHTRRSHCEKDAVQTDDPDLCKCLMCSKVFQTTDNLETHVRRVHEKPLIHQCDLCDRTFLRRDAMLNHKESHMGRTYQCELCDKSYSTSLNMKAHIRKKHMKLEDLSNFSQNAIEIICEFCQRAFCNKASLREHIRTRHSNDVQLFTCTLCQMKFTRRNSLQRHLKKSCRMLGSDVHAVGLVESDAEMSPSEDTLSQYYEDDMPQDHEDDVTHCTDDVMPHVSDDDMPQVSDDDMPQCTDSIASQCDDDVMPQYIDGKAKDSKDDMPHCIDALAPQSTEVKEPSCIVAAMRQCPADRMSRENTPNNMPQFAKRCDEGHGDTEKGNSIKTRRVKPGREKDSSGKNLDLITKKLLSKINEHVSRAQRSFCSEMEYDVKLGKEADEWLNDGSTNDQGVGYEVAEKGVSDRNSPDIQVSSSVPNNTELPFQAAAVSHDDSDIAI